MDKPTRLYSEVTSSSGNETDGDQCCYNLCLEPKTTPDVDLKHMSFISCLLLGYIQLINLHIQIT